ncbi:MAG TPA: single-stranded DNA-binding protein [Mucilaginibacter sp.]|jgi:single-strand DNA-binding protein|nr:single-stranded DNA-binding protein [Mucilaginibacter sp.]
MYFTGRLTADAAVRNVKGDWKVTGFNVAINDRFKTKDGEKREITTYVECSYWVNPGLAEYLKKGVIVEISGRVEAHAWKNKDGEAQANLTCNVSTIKLLGKSNTNRLERQDTKSKVTSTGGDEDDLPF